MELQESGLSQLQTVAEEDCTGLQLSEENMNQNVTQFNTAILRAAKEEKKKRVYSQGMKTPSKLHS